MIVGHPVVIEMVSVKAKMAKILSLARTIVVVIMMEHVNQKEEKILYRVLMIVNRRLVMKMVYVNPKTVRMKPTALMIVAPCHHHHSVIITMYAMLENIGRHAVIVPLAHSLHQNITM
jgi:hypothetical protein